MPDQVNKLSDLANTIKDYLSKQDYTPGLIGAAGGAGISALSSMQAREGENPRQRALRVLRNAAAGGVLGGVGLQAVVQGGSLAKNQTFPPPSTEAPKPGMASSIPARLVYMGGVRGVGQWLREKGELRTLKKLMPDAGFGPVSFRLAKSERSKVSNPTPGTIPLNSASQVVTHRTAGFPLLSDESVSDPAKRKMLLSDTDKVFRNLRDTSPLSFNRALKALEQQVMKAGLPLRSDAVDYLRANYSRGPEARPWGINSMLRANNFITGHSVRPGLRAAGHVASPLALVAAGLSPEIINTLKGSLPAEKAVGGYLTSPVTPPAPPNWIDKMTQGYDLRPEVMKPQTP
jgi:hypothetical protein